MASLKFALEYILEALEEHLPVTINNEKLYPDWAHQVICMAKNSLNEHEVIITRDPRLGNVDTRR